MSFEWWMYITQLKYNGRISFEAMMYFKENYEHILGSWYNGRMSFEAVTYFQESYKHLLRSGG
jgi:hypothetical protein